MGNSQSSEWLNKFNEIKSNHDEAYHLIDEGLTMDEQLKTNQAIEKYKEGLRLIDKALNVQILMPKTADYYWEEGLRMIQRMKKTRRKILERLEEIQQEYPDFQEYFNNNSQKNISQLYSDLGKVILNFCMELKDYDSEIFYTYVLVKLFFINQEGEIVQAEGDQKLIIAFMEKNNRSQYFINLGAKIYPLIEGIFLCHKTENNVYILPDLTSESQGAPCIAFSLNTDRDEYSNSLLNNIFLSTENKKSGSEIDKKIKELGISPEEFLTFEENLKNKGNIFCKCYQENTYQTKKFQFHELANPFFSTDANIFGTLYSLSRISTEKMLQKHTEDRNESTPEKLYPDLREMKIANENE